MRRISVPSLSIVHVAVAAVAGCTSVQVLPRLPPAWVAAVVGAVALLVVWRGRSQVTHVLAIGALFAAWTLWRAHGAMGVRIPHAWEGHDMVVSGQVAGLPTSRGHDITFLFTPDQDPVAGYAPSGTWRITWHRAPRMPQACERWRLSVRLRRPRAMVNPGGFDSERHALERRIGASGYVRRSDHNRKLERPICVDGWRQRMAEQIDARVGERPARVLKALAMGDTRGLDGADWDIARATGVSHLIAISGFHVAVAASIGAALVRLAYLVLPWLPLVWPVRLAQALAGMSVGIAYGVLAGMSLPTVRTLLMAGVVVFAVVARRPVSGISLLAFAAAVILLADPLAVLSAGFWLSFAGVAFLILCLRPPEATTWRGRILGILKAQALMSIALLPLSLWLFGSTSLVAFPANLVAAPLVSMVVVPATLLGCVLLPWPRVADAPLHVAASTIETLWAGLQGMADWPGSHFSVAQSGLAPVVLATCGAAWIFCGPWRQLRPLGAWMFLPLVHPVRHDPPPGALRAWVLDVGQGLAVLVRTQTHTLVYDTGPLYGPGNDAGASVVLPSLAALGLGRPNLLVVSHGDADHAGGVASILRRFPTVPVVSGEAARLSVPASACPSEPWWWDGVRFQAVPAAPARSARANEQSCMLVVEGTSGRFILTGDAGVPTERHMPGHLVRSATPTVTTVAHHGSRHASSLAWLRQVRPAFAIASAGWRNRFGHPHPHVVDRHASVGAQVLVTARSGAVAIEFPAEAAPFVSREWRRPITRYWRE